MIVVCGKRVKTRAIGVSQHTGERLLRLNVAGNIQFSGYCCYGNLGVIILSKR